MRNWGGEVPQVGRVLLRIEWADGQVREFDVEQPYGLDVEIKRPSAPFAESPLVPEAIYGGDALSVAVSFKVGPGSRLPLTIRTAPGTVLVTREDLAMALNEDAWPLEEAEAACGRLRQALDAVTPRGS